MIEVDTAIGPQERTPRKSAIAFGRVISTIWQVGSSDYGARHRSARDQPSKSLDGVLD